MIEWMQTHTLISSSAHACTKHVYYVLTYIHMHIQNYRHTNYLTFAKIAKLLPTNQYSIILGIHTIT